MIDVSGLKLTLRAGLPENHEQALSEVARQLGLEPDAIKSAQLIKRSVDARKKTNVHFTATYRLELNGEAETNLLKRADRCEARLRGLQINPSKPYVPLELPVLATPAVSPVVVGAGPAGLFCSWYLAKCGLQPILIEQGAPVEERARDVAEFFTTGELDPLSNIQFGEGGAGTFSDGKLTTNTKNRFTAHVLRWFVDAGAPEDILWQAHPHLGSDNLPGIVARIREDIIALGGKVWFHTRLIGMEFEQGRLRAIQLEEVEENRSSQPSDKKRILQELPCEVLVLACGHSARSTFELVRDAGFAMEQKPFSMGVRIEHPQQLINEAQWGSAAQHPALGAAEYKLAIHLPSGRSVYSFCMCPGGEVVAAASEEGGVVTNGMSDYARAGKNANAALLVNVDPEDFGSDDVLAGIKLQRAVERQAFQVAQEQGGAPYQAPAQRLGDFLNEEPSHSGSEIDSSFEGGVIVESDTERGLDNVCQPTYERGVIRAPLDRVLPAFVTDALREAIPLMARKISGFDDQSALLTAPETRSSSPVRICRDDSLQAYFTCTDAPSMPSFKRSGVYPCGEGPGFAGGIMSAAVDGLKVATRIVQRYQRTQVVDALRAGEPAIFPTDTVYGLGVAVNWASSPEALYELKQRANDKPIAWLVGSVDDLEAYGKNVSQQAKELARQHWPGALTLVVEASDAVPDAFQSSAGTIALRMPDHETALDLIRKVGPLAATSANLSGQSAPVRLADVPSELCERVASLDGKSYDALASTVVDCTTPDFRILRQGHIVL